VSAAAFFASVLGAYLLGSISFAYLIARRVAGVDLRTVGSGNLGATNAGRVLGRRWAVVIYALDGLKGVAAVLAPPVLLGLLDVPAGAFAGVPVTVACGLAVMLGHIFPFYLRFKGGKGVATGSGVMLALSPLAGLATLAVWWLTLKLGRMVSLGSIVAALALPFIEAAVGRGRAHHEAHVAFFAGIGALVVFMHRRNVQRILAGVEPKIGEKTA